MHMHIYFRVHTRVYVRTFVIVSVPIRMCTCAGVETHACIVSVCIHLLHGISGGVISSSPFTLRYLLTLKIE